MSTLGVMNKNAGQDTRIYGLHDNLFRRRVDLQREEGSTEFQFPAGSGMGTRNAMVWSSEPRDLPYAGRKHFPAYTRHRRLGYQDSASRDNTPQPEHRVSNKYEHLKKSSIFPFDEVKQKGSPVDKRNGIGVANPGDKPYREPEQSSGFYRTAPLEEEVPGLERSITSAPPALQTEPPRSYQRWKDRHTLQDIQDVRDIETWKPIVSSLLTEVE